MKRLVIELDYTKFTLWALNITTGSMKEMAKYLVYPASTKCRTQDAGCRTQEGHLRPVLHVASIW